MKFSTLIFDMDGVIIDSEVLYNVADAEFFRRHNKPHNHEEISLLLTGMSLRSGTALLKEKYGFSGEVDDLLLERQALVEAEYNTHLNYIVGFEAFYEKVLATGMKTCIATSSNDHLLGIAAKRLGLDKKFGKNIFKASDVGNASKPDPAIYLYAAKQMGVEPSTCMVIEDSPKGIEAAHNAGMFCIGITTSFAKEHLSHADIVVGSYEEINLFEYNA